MRNEGPSTKTKTKTKRIRKIMSIEGKIIVKEGDKLLCRWQLN